MSAYHWDIKHPAQGCNVNRWEVNDWPCSYVPSTFHQIWVRQSGVNPRVGETAINQGFNIGYKFNAKPCNPYGNC